MNNNDIVEESIMCYLAEKLPVELYPDIAVTLMARDLAHIAKVAIARKAMMEKAEKK